jgi:hypothetical protein
MNTRQSFRGPELAAECRHLVLRGEGGGRAGGPGRRGSVAAGSLWLVLVLVVGAWPCGCAAPGDARREQTLDGTAALAGGSGTARSGGGLADQFDEAARKLEELYRLNPGVGVGRGVGGASPELAAMGSRVVRPAGEAAMSERRTEPVVVEAPVQPAPLPPATGASIDSSPSRAVAPAPAEASREETPGQREARLVAELASALSDQARASRDPFREAVALALLSGIDPSVRGDEHWSRLTPDQAAGVRALAGLAARLGAARGRAGDAPDVAVLGEALREAAQAAAPLSGLRVSTAVLTSRVESFGRYTPLAGTTFLAGRASPVILYTELENFAQSRAGDAPIESAAGDLGDAALPGDWVVSLSQQVELYAADGTRVWARPEQVVRDRARTLRRDFFLVQRLDLPSTLSVGSYTLRVTVRDRLSGGLAERSIPITIVADRSAVVPTPGAQR